MRWFYDFPKFAPNCPFYKDFDRVLLSLLQVGIQISFSQILERQLWLCSVWSEMYDRNASSTSSVIRFMNMWLIVLCFSFYWFVLFYVFFSPHHREDWHLVDSTLMQNCLFLFLFSLCLFIYFFLTTICIFKTHCLSHFCFTSWYSGEERAQMLRICLLPTLLEWTPWPVASVMLPR